MSLHRTLGLTLALAALPAIAAAQKTTYDYDKTATFTQFKTYSWKEGTPTKNELLDKRLVAAIEDQMAKKGLVKNDTAPDVFVVFHIAFDEQKDISSVQHGPDVRRVRIWLGRRMGIDDHRRQSARDPGRDPRDRPHRRQQEGRRLARPGHEGNRHECQT